MVLKDTIANSIISLEEAISNIQPGGQEWSEHAATQDVDLDGHKITGLGEPTDAADAATKAYVDSQSGGGGGGTPDRIKGGAGTTYEETEIGVGPDATGAPGNLLSGKNRGDEFLRLYARESNAGNGWLGWYYTRSGYGTGYVSWSTDTAAIRATASSGEYAGVRADGKNGGNVYFQFPGASAGGGYDSLAVGIRLASRSGYAPYVRALPSNVNSILHGIKLGVDAHDELANYDWSEYPAVQDVDLNTFKITNLADPTNPQDAATKAYVDANSGGGGTPSKIESPSGNTSVESIDFSAEEAGTIMKSTRGDSESIIAVVVSEDEIDPLETQSEVIIGVHNPNGPDGAWIEAKYLTRNNQFELAAGGAPLYIEEPVEDRHAATKGYVDSRFAVEWWEPTWTPVANVSGVSNIECQYTRAYRAAGGSLVTLEGTITVTPEAAGGCAVEADIPLPVTGSTGVTGVASAADVASVYPAYATLIGGKVRLIFLAESTDEHVVPFRLSYRAA